MRELKDLLIEYEQNLCDKLFVLVLSNKKEINFRFFRENLCHLMGPPLQRGRSSETDFLSYLDFCRCRISQHDILLP